jgi:hypothetical protein
MQWQTTMMYDTFGASYARQGPDDDYVKGRSDVWHSWSLCLLDFLKKHHVKFRMTISVLGDYDTFKDKILYWSEKDDSWIQYMLLSFHVLKAGGGNCVLSFPQ